NPEDFSCQTRASAAWPFPRINSDSCATAPDALQGRGNGIPSGVVHVGSRYNPRTAYRRSRRSTSFRFCGPGCRQRLIRDLPAVWHRNSADVTAFSVEISDHPVSFPELDIFQLQSCSFRPAETTTDQDSDHGSVPSLFGCRCSKCADQSPPL